MKQFKKTIRLAMAFLFCSITGQVGAQGLKEFFNSSATPLVYLGVDFSLVKMINDPGANVFDIKNKYFHGINEVIVDEMGRNYKISSAFQKDNVSTDISEVEVKNDKTNSDQMSSNNTADFHRLTEADISAEIKKLGSFKSTGIGLVFVMEAMKKEDKKGYGSVWVTLIDMKTKKVLMTERMEDDATGIGFRNYWASVFKKIIITINKKKYAEWKSRFGS